jgi:hypothetical protein
VSTRLLFILVLSLPATALAQEQTEYLLTHKQTKEQAATQPKCPPDAPKVEKPPSPWTFKFRMGSLFQFNNSKGVVGVRDGSSKSFALDSHAEANWDGGQHEWRNRFDLAAVFVKTPNLRQWVAASNLVEVETIYQYRILPWAGPFVRLGVATSMVVGRDLRVNSVQYQLPDGSLTEERTDYRLTDPFMPTTFLQTVGGFVNPIREKEFDLDFRAGLGAREIFADGQLGVKDLAETPMIVELVQLRDYQQAGIEFIVMIRGELWDKKVQYFTGGEFLLPLVRTREAGDDRSAWDVMDSRFRAGVAYKLAKWATVLYEFRVLHQPQLIDEVQIQNYFGIKASYSIN